MKFATKLLAVAFAGCLGVAAPAQKAGVHQDPKKGFSLRVPDKWTTVPVSIDEKWIVAKFLSNRTYETKSRDYTDYGEHKPMVLVIEFSDEARKLRVDEEKRGDTTYINKNVPFRDYKDYLKRNLNEGFYVEKEEAGTEAGVPCTKFTVRIEKSASMKRRVLAWVFRGTKGEFAVETEALEDHYEKLEPMMLTTLKSFKLIPITVFEASNPVTGGGSTENMWVRDRRKWRELPIGERQNRRKKIEEERMAKIQKDLPAGWVAKRTKNYLVLAHADPKFTARLIEAAEAYRIWLDAMFGTVSDEYVMQGVIRVCADRDEAIAYSRGSSDDESFNSDNREVITFQDKGEGNAGTSWGRLFVGMLDQYIYDKDSLLYSDLPSWLHVSLYRYVEGAKMRGGKMVYEPEEWENDAVRDVIRAETCETVKELMSGVAEERESGKATKREFWAQAARLVRFILGPGSKRPELDGFLLDYMKRTIKAAEKHDAEFYSVKERATTEEEEEKRSNNRRDYWKKRRIAVLETVQKELAWSSETQDGLEKAFSAFLKK
jgi:hypothetical protein